MKVAQQLWQIEVIDEATGEDRSVEFFNVYSGKPSGAWPSREAHMRLRYICDWYAQGAHYMLPGLKFRMTRWQAEPELNFVAEAPLLEG